MGPNSNIKQHEHEDNVNHEQCGETQKYVKDHLSKEVENLHHAKYSIASEIQGAKHPAKKSKRCTCLKTCPKNCSKRKSMSLAERASHCYDIVRLGRKNECTKKRIWQRGKFVRDDCGSGIVPKRFDFMPSRRIWCKTPLTVYQATIGELGRKMLCREVILPKDVPPAPPCNVGTYIMPKCRGYYRKYDCIRPCEEEFAVTKGGVKRYRDRVERYWEPCLGKYQKHKVDVNDYAPHNVFLGTKVRRKIANQSCW